MNSTSEAIYWGVPIVGIPILVDQPRVAYRILDELGFGIRLSVHNLTIKSIQDAVFTVLNEKSYSERILRYSKISRKYDGVKNSTNYCIEFIETHINKNG
jgi:UDP:flavonoid glycosyltransferase YjiC (YdhE family)